MTKERLTIVKTGGKLLDDERRMNRFLSSFAALKGKKIMVHGGGSLASRLSIKWGITPQMADGRRITTAEDLRLVTMVYAGWLNKTVVARLQQKGCNATGLSGADGNAILSRKRPVKTIDYGFVGDVVKVNTPFIQSLLQQDGVPVFSAITHDGKGTLLNTNADTVAAEIAVAMATLYDVRLVYCFEKKGVLENVEQENSVIPELDFARYKVGVEQGMFNAGMLPKLQTGFNALKQNVGEVWIGDETILNENSDGFTRLKR